MTLADAMEFCESMPEAEITTPFGPEVLVFKVCGKLFALTDPDAVPPKMNLKCDPERAVLLRDEYEAITPGYHMNKRHWNTVEFNHSVSEALLRELIVHSYQLVVAGLKKADRDRLQSSNG